MDEATFNPGQLVRLKDPTTIVTGNPDDSTFWELIQGIPLYYVSYEAVFDSEPSDFPHKTTVVGVFVDVLKSRPSYEDFKVNNGWWFFRDGELEAIHDE